MLIKMSAKPAAKTTVHVLPGVMDLFRARFKESKKLKTIWTAAAWMALQSPDAELSAAYEAAKDAHEAAQALERKKAGAQVADEVNSETQTRTRRPAKKAGA